MKRRLLSATMMLLFMLTAMLTLLARAQTESEVDGPAMLTADAVTRQTAAGSVVIGSPNIFVRSGAGVDYGPVGSLDEGASLLPFSIDETGQWVLIAYHGSFGWIRADLGRWTINLNALPVLMAGDLTPSPRPRVTLPYLTLTRLFDPSVTPEGSFINVGPIGANVRTGPGEIYAVLGLLLDGDVVEPVARDMFGEWVMIHFDDRFAWISRDLVHWIVNIDDLPVLDAGSTPTATFTITSSPTSTDTPSPTDTATASATPTETSTPTDTATSTLTSTLTDTPTGTATTTPSETNSPTVTDFPSPTASHTLLPTSTDTATFTSTATATDTATDLPTATSSPTEPDNVPPTVVVAAAVASDTTVPTPTPIPSLTPTNTSVPTATATFTDIPTATSTDSPSPTTAPSDTPISTHTPVPTEPPPATITTAITEPSIVPVTTQPPTPVPPVEAAEAVASPNSTLINAPVASATDDFITGQGDVVASDSPDDGGSGFILIGGAAVVLALGYAILFIRGLRGAGRYRDGFPVERCPVCAHGHLHLEQQRHHLLGIPRVRRVVRCDVCRSTLRETGYRRWRYAVDRLDNVRMYQDYNGREVDEQTLRLLAENPPDSGAINVPPEFTDDEDV